jgi:hypothetical protein
MRSSIHSRPRLVGGLLALGIAVTSLTLAPAIGASATPSGCSTHASGRDLGWYGDATCTSGSGEFRAKAVCNGAGGSPVGNWVGIGSTSSAWCGWWGVYSISWQTR